MYFFSDRFKHKELRYCPVIIFVFSMMGYPYVSCINRLKGHLRSRMVKSKSRPFVMPMKYHHYNPIHMTCQGPVPSILRDLDRIAIHIALRNQSRKYG